MPGGDEREAKETSYEKALAEIAMKKWNDYRKKSVPFENKAMKDVTDPSKVPAMARALSGQVNADIQQQLPARALGEGVDPSSGEFRVMDTARETAEKGSRAIADVRQSARDQRVKALQAVTDIGRGQASDAQLGMQDLAATSVKGAISDTYANLEEEAALGNTIGSALGLGGKFAFDKWDMKGATA